MILYVCLLSLILSALVAVNNWSINRSSIFLSAILIVISVFALNHHFIAGGGSKFWLAILYNNFAPFWYLAGPFLLWYTRSVIKDRIQFYQVDLIHLLPFFIHLIGIIPYLFTSFDYKLSVAEQLLSDSSKLRTLNVNWLVPIEINLLARPMLLVGYCAFSAMAFYRHLQKFKGLGVDVQEPQSNSVKRWYFIFTGILTIIGINYLVAGIQFLNAPEGSGNLFNLPVALFSSFLIAVLPILLLVFPEVIYGLPRRITEPKTEPEKNSVPNPASPFYNSQAYFDDVAKRIMACFENDTLFLDPDFSVESLADKLSIPRHHIYYCLNSVIGKKFTSLKTTYRIKYAQKLLLEIDLNRFTIDSIGLRSGFASRSSFYSAFREVTNLTPTEFLAQHGKSAAA